jgi:hypothetical protein
MDFARGDASSRNLLLLPLDRCLTRALVVCAFAGGWVWLSTIAQRTRQIGVAPPGYDVPLVRVEVLLACCEAPCCDHVCKSSWLLPIGERRIPPLIFRCSLCLAVAAVVAAQELEVVARVIR